MTNETTITAHTTEPVIDIERVLDAPVAEVFRAYTDADLVKQWLGPHGYEMDVARYDISDGGGYEYIHRNPAGDEFAFRGVVHSVVPLKRIIQTFEYLGAAGHVSLESVEFEDLGERTRLRGHSVYASIADRDALIDNGMSKGVNDGFERMDALLARQHA
jgi:uncharacterized protein YndB with AHSA1/START domain